ncbi:MAG: pyrroline-5-carboxylate reductase [Alphaproteobacteria bacterium]
MTTSGPVVLVGRGKMGSALLAGWLARGLAPSEVHSVEPQPYAPPPAGVVEVAEAGALPAGLAPKVVVLAVKPQGMDAVLPAYRRFAGPGTVFLSIAAGRPLAFFARHLGDGAAVVRAMPNTPAAVGRGITVLCANARVAPGQLDVCRNLMSAVGAVETVADEALMDPVTAVSGSGPAYVFLLVEAMAAAGVAAGLPADLAMKLARETVAGSGALLAGAAEDAATLRKNVTSPGGTTAAALAVLMDEGGGLGALMTRAIDAATKRSRELAG